MVMIFGVFDGVHDGHRSLFREARSHGAPLMAVVTRDDVALRLKGRMPKRALTLRIADLMREPEIDAAIEGDAELGSWGVVRRHKPSHIVVGYDQEKLRADLERHLGEFDWQPVIVTAAPHKPDTHHSSLMG
ncbi:MAG TPA: adenylyltransferase/cytidyltransferase family protein [Candidatus Paceibacterota bacterium]|nr:adenylyltransferase/cytidyltransferase family protein [Candidatus Paceibacterota bacterium]